MIKCPRCAPSLGSALRAKVTLLREGGSASAWHHYGKRFCVLCRAELVIPKVMAVEYALRCPEAGLGHERAYQEVAIALRDQYGLPTD